MGVPAYLKNDLALMKGLGKSLAHFSDEDLSEDQTLREEPEPAKGVELRQLRGLLDSLKAAVPLIEEQQVWRAIIQRCGWAGVIESGGKGA